MQSYFLGLYQGNKICLVFGHNSENGIVDLDTSFFNVFNIQNKCMKILLSQKCMSFRITSHIHRSKLIPIHDIIKKTTSFKGCEYFLHDLIKSNFVWNSAIFVEMISFTISNEDLRFYTNWYLFYYVTTMFIF